MADSSSMFKTCRVALSLSAVLALSGFSAEVQSRYYGHVAVHDRYGVIAPWYHGLNGQCDFRVRIAAETIVQEVTVHPGRITLVELAARQPR